LSADLELTTLGWVHWHNTERLSVHLRDDLPGEFEQALDVIQVDRQKPVGTDSVSLHQSQGAPTVATAAFFSVVGHALHYGRNTVQPNLS
jgi:hypothetical protein